mmetsp:Transcript_11823/g.22686  ORF Transcript_11823/g.22686 Transcript_11823/m.22686 type:complete len:152 (+) Transcript_11823:493-948(+)
MLLIYRTTESRKPRPREFPSMQQQADGLIHEEKKTCMQCKFREASLRPTIPAREERREYSLPPSLPPIFLARPNRGFLSLSSLACPFLRWACSAANLASQPPDKTDSSTPRYSTQLTNQPSPLYCCTITVLFFYMTFSLFVHVKESSTPPL